VLRKEDGFTLIELIIVVAIIAILGAVVTPNILKAIESSRVVAVVADSKSIQSAALAYHADTGAWPESTASSESGESGETGGKDPGLAEKPSEGSDLEGWNGPYLDRWPEKNPWGGTYTLTKNVEGEEGGGNGDKLYLKLSKVPESAVDKLEDKLGKDVTKATGDDHNNIYIYLAE
jgi:general secretion pathway protein G